MFWLQLAGKMLVAVVACFGIYLVLRWGDRPSPGEKRYRDDYVDRDWLDRLL
jgi:hypothetical protein